MIKNPVENHWYLFDYDKSHLLEYTKEFLLIWNPYPETKAIGQDNTFQSL